MSIHDTDIDAAAATGEAAGVAVDGSIRRLNPQDGLFLKAEHLDGIQDYGRALSRALGTAYGSGVVHGFGLSLQENQLVAGGGLAVTVTGEPLLCTSPLRLPLDNDHVPALDDDGYWLVVLEPGSQLSGSENAYGTVCDDPCDGTRTLHPWLTSTVVLRLRPRTMPGLDSVVDPRRRRNALASGYFEQDRREGAPWTTPRAAGLGVAPLLNNPWDQAGVAPEPDGVPIGVMLKVDGQYVLDMWTARREVGGPPAPARWAGHLGMRPWPMFWAQVLQFMAQLKEENLASGNALQAHRVDEFLVVDQRQELVDQWVDELPPSALKRGKTLEFVQRWRAAPPSYAREVKTVSLLDLGFEELPPAGYLAPVADDKGGIAKVARLFAETVTLRYCRVRADSVAGAIQAAQHLDRIPLRQGSDPQPEVDILLPTVPADLDPLRTDAYGWVAFVRRTPSSCEEAPAPEKPKEEVVVLEVEGEVAEVVRLIVSGTVPAAKKLTTIVYEAGEADLPQDQLAAPAGALAWDGSISTGPSGDALDLAKARQEVVVRTWGLADDKHVVTTPGKPPMIMLVGHPR